MSAGTAVVAKPLKWAAIGGIALTLTCGAAYAKSTINNVAPKAGEGAGIGVGGVPLFLQNFGKGIGEMQTQPGPAAPAPAAPLTAAG